MRPAFVLSAYDRTDDLLAHLDVLSFFPGEHHVIPIWTHQSPPQHFLDGLSAYPSAKYCDGLNFHAGPILALLSGLQEADKVGADYVIYRNGDDWQFNHEFVKQNLAIMEESGYWAAGYNWLSVDSYYEFALNEMYLKVDKFAPLVAAAEHQFRTETNYALPCEWRFARWLMNVINKDVSKFYRIPFREAWPGIGQLFKVPKSYSKLPPDEQAAYMEAMKDNNRWFNRKWQLIGSHDNSERKEFYQSIRGEIAYVDDLEQRPHFSRWVSGGDWNMPTVRRFATTADQKVKSPRPHFTVPVKIIRPRTRATTQ